MRVVFLGEGGLGFGSSPAVAEVEQGFLGRH